MTVIAATSAFAEQTFPLATRHLNTYLISQMKEETFHKLGILAWYDREDIDGIIDFFESEMILLLTVQNIGKNGWSKIHKG